MKKLKEKDLITISSKGYIELTKKGNEIASSIYERHCILYEALKKMDDEGKLKINLAECYNIRSYDSEIYKTRVDEVKEIVKNYSSSHLHPEYIKLFADGIVEAGTGWMIEPYANGSYGNIIWNQPEFDAIITYANHNGILIHAHTYGDAACKSLLDSFINSNEINGKQYRNCLAHVRNITEVDMDRAFQNNISVAANMIWHSDYDLDDPSRKAIIDNIGESRYLKGYQMKTLLNKGINISSSTDAPAATSLEGSVLNVIEVAVTGQEPESNISPFAPNELLKEWLASEANTLFPGPDYIKPECQYGESRFDMYLEKDDRRIFMEAKGCTLEWGWLGLFPDAPTERGAKHLWELIEAVKEGYECYLVFVIQINGITHVRPNRPIDPDFADAMRAAIVNGVKVLNLECHIEPDSLEVVGYNIISNL